MVSLLKAAQYLPLSGKAKTPPPPTSSFRVRASRCFGYFSRTMETAEGVQYLSRLVAAVAATTSPILNMQNMISTAFAGADNFVGAMRIILDGKYFLGSTFANELSANSLESSLSVIHHTAFLLSDAAVSLQFAESLHLLDLAALSQTMGSASIVGGAVTMGQFVLCTALIGFLIWGIECAVRMHRGDRSALNSISLARCVSEIVNKPLALSSSAVSIYETVLLSNVVACAAAALALSNVAILQNFSK